MEAGRNIGPASNPWDYLLALLERAPVLLYGQWFLPDIKIYGLMPKPFAYLVLAGVCIVLAGLAIVLLPLIRRNSVARFWALGMVLVLVPISAAIPSSRMLIFVGLGAFGLLAQIFVILLVLVHFVAAPITLPFQAHSLAAFQEREADELLAFAKHEPVDNKTLIYVNTPSRITNRSMRQVCPENGLMPPMKNLTPASGTPYPMTIERRDDLTLEVQPRNGFLTGRYDTMWRGPSYPIHSGRLYRPAICGLKCFPWPGMGVHCVYDFHSLALWKTLHGSLSNGKTIIWYPCNRPRSANRFV